MKRTATAIAAIVAVSAFAARAQGPADEGLFKTFTAVCDATDADAAKVERAARAAGFLKAPDAYAPKAAVPQIRQSKTLWKISEGKVMLLTTGRAPVANIQGPDSDVCSLSVVPGAQGEVAAFRRWAEVPGTTGPTGTSFFYRQSAGPHQSLAATPLPEIQAAILAGDTRVAFYTSSDGATAFILFRPKT